MAIKTALIKPEDMQSLPAISTADNTIEGVLGFGRRQTLIGVFSPLTPHGGLRHLEDRAIASLKKSALRSHTLKYHVPHESVDKLGNIVFVNTEEQVRERALLKKYSSAFFDETFGNGCIGLTISANESEIRRFLKDPDASNLKIQAEFPVNIGWVLQR